MRPTRSRKVAAVAAVLAMTGLAACDPPPPPKVLVVTSSADASDAAPGDGVCLATGPGACTLRAALQEASASPIDLIELGVGIDTTAANPLTVAPVAGVLTVVAHEGTAIVRTGRGPAIDVQGGSVVFAGALAVAAGWTTVPVGVAVRAGATAIFDGVRVHGSGGAGIQVAGTAVVVDAQLSANGTGVQVTGTGSATLLRSVVRGSSTGVDVAAGGTASLLSSTVSGNSTGIHNQGTATLTLSTVAEAREHGVLADAPVTVRGSVVVAGDEWWVEACSGSVVSAGFNGLGSGCGRTATDVAVTASALRAMPPDPIWPEQWAVSPFHRLGSGGAALVGLMDVGEGPCASGVVDQRDVDRTTDGTCTAGAYEGPISSTSTWTVTTAADGVDADPGDGVCATSAGTCTLRAAMTEADLGDPGGPVPQVAFTQGVSPIVDPALGDLPANHMLVRGTTGGTTISTAGFVHCEGTLRFEDVTLLGGGVDSSCTVSPPMDPRGRIELARATLTGAAVHGDMLGDVSLLVHQSTISGHAGDAIGSDFTQVVVTSSRIVDNGGAGIGLGEHSGSILVADSVIAGNRSGIGLEYGNVTVSRSLLADNDLAAIFTSAGWVQIVDSTLSGNGIGVSEGFDGTTTIRRSTLIGNGTGYRSSDAYARLELAGSVIQGGTPCAPGETPITSYGWNVISDASCGVTGTGDLQGVDALLGPLADNGGPTLTHLPAAGSPAIDAIPSGTAGLCTVGLVDQRGVSRPQGPACDRGAVEQ